MERIPVVSSNIESIGYEPDAQTLEVGFLKGGVWRYTGVSPEEYAALTSAPSVGSYFQKNIRNSYPGAKVSE